MYTSSGEMIITLDDVLCLLHLLVSGSFYTTPLNSVVIDTTIQLTANMLGVTEAEAVEETSITHGAYFRFEWVPEVCAFPLLTVEEQLNVMRRSARS